MANLIPISTVVVGSGGASAIEFNSIPQSYTDLKIVVSARTTAAAAYLALSYNGSTSNFSSRWLSGNGTTAGSFADTPRFGGTVVYNGWTVNTFSSHDIYIPNYTASNNKSTSIDSVTEQNATQSFAELTASLYSNTLAITSISLTTSSGNFAQYSSATLYGIRKY